jgi:hypothetical protein
MNTTTNEQDSRGGLVTVDDGRRFELPSVAGQFIAE